MLLNNLPIRRRVSPYHEYNDYDQENPPSSVELVCTHNNSGTIHVKQKDQDQDQQQQHPTNETGSASNPLWYYRTLAFFIVSIVLVNIIRVGISTLDIGKRAPPVAATSSYNPDSDIWHVTELSVGDKKQTTTHQDKSSPLQVQKHRNKTKTTSSISTSNGVIDSSITTSTKILPGAALGLGDVAAEALKQQQPHVTTTTIIKQKHVLVVGGAGFVGFHTSIYLKRLGHSVVVVDSMQSQYYTNELQQVRSQILQKEYGITVYITNICEISTHPPYSKILQQHRITHVIYLAAQPFYLYGNTNSTTSRITNSELNNIQNNLTSVNTQKLFEYPPNNIDCFATMLDLLQYQDIHLLYAINHHWNGNPQTEALYSPERLLAKAYYTLYGLASVGIEFPTTYGSFGRPDHDYYKLVAAALSSSKPATIQLPIIQAARDKLSNSSRKTLHTSLIFVDDVVRGIVSATDFVFDGSQVVTLGKSCSFSWENVGIPTILDVANQKNGSYAPPLIVEVDISQDMPNFPPDMFKEEEADNRCHELANDRIPLDTGMTAFVKWFELEQGERFVLNDMERNVTTHNDSIAPLRLNIEGDNDDASLISTNGNQHLNHICFVTSLFVEDDNYTAHDGKDSNNSPKKNKLDHKDKLASTTHLDHSLPYLFFSFTNIIEENPPNDGWERIVLQHIPFHRFVTGSLWPKYMGWKHFKLSTCRIICYSDASLRPKDLLLADWMNLAQVAIEHGIIHQDHSSPEVTVMEELGDRNGTIPFTATKAKAWFLQQTDFNNESPRYKTNAFVYDPYNEKIRELMTTFWAHYSQENDVSWKDQPLYRYLLSKLRIQPASFPSIDEEKRTGEIKDFWEDDWEEDIHFLGSN